MYSDVASVAKMGLPWAWWGRQLEQSVDRRVGPDRGREQEGILEEVQGEAEFWTNTKTSGDAFNK